MSVMIAWFFHVNYKRGCQKNAAVHGIKEPRNSRGIDSTGMVFKNLNDFLPAFADFSRASPYDFTHVALTLPLGGAGGEVLGLLQTEQSRLRCRWAERAARCWAFCRPNTPASASTHSSMRAIRTRSGTTSARTTWAASGR